VGEVDAVFEVVAAVNGVAEGGVVKFELLGQFCEAIAGLVHDHPLAAEYTARKMGQIFTELQRKEDARHQLEREDDAARRAAGARF
jgi:hypothetical protein